MTLEGWVPEIGPYLSLAEVIEFAFDYRGNTTIVKTDGSEVVGYVFNRNRSVAVPFIQFFDERGGGPFTLPYAEIATVKFTGKDTAAGNSWKAWVERREREKAGAVAPSGAPVRAADPDLHRG
jgi:hypothetical protein